MGKVKLRESKGEIKENRESIRGKRRWGRRDVQRRKRPKQRRNTQG